jgi:hypothetical protein
MSETIYWSGFVTGREITTTTTTIFNELLDFALKVFKIKILPKFILCATVREMSTLHTVNRLRNSISQLLS